MEDRHRTLLLLRRKYAVRCVFFLLSLFFVLNDMIFLHTQLCMRLRRRLCVLLHSTRQLAGYRFNMVRCRVWYRPLWHYSSAPQTPVFIPAWYKACHPPPTPLFSWLLFCSDFCREPWYLAWLVIAGSNFPWYVAKVFFFYIFYYFRIALMMTPSTLNIMYVTFL